MGRLSFLLPASLPYPFSPRPPHISSKELMAEDKKGGRDMEGDDCWERDGWRCLFLPFRNPTYNASVVRLGLAGGKGGLVAEPDVCFLLLRPSSPSLHPSIVPFLP